MFTIDAIYEDGKRCFSVLCRYRTTRVYACPAETVREDVLPGSQSGPCFTRSWPNIWRRFLRECGSGTGTSLASLSMSSESSRVRYSSPYFLRLVCQTCGQNTLVVFSCKGRASVPPALSGECPTRRAPCRSRDSVRPRETMGVVAALRAALRAALPASLRSRDGDVRSRLNKSLQSLSLTPPAPFFGYPTFDLLKRPCSGSASSFLLESVGSTATNYLKEGITYEVHSDSGPLGADRGCRIWPAHGRPKSR